MATATIVTSKGTKRITAYPSGVPGLVVHREVGDKPQGWAVTHEPTGLGLPDPGCDLDRKADAIKWAKALGTLTDWTAEATAIKAAVNRRMINAATEDYHGALPSEIDDIPISPKLKRMQIMGMAEAQMCDLSNPGFCVACGAEAEGVEPDARKYRCEECGEMAVYGAEELALRIC
jgi:predicted RNA-binding Zn-ribbon protein involved in translation (DUF1610 family)